MKTKDKIKIINYWLEDNSHFFKIPPTLKSKYNEDEDSVMLIQEIGINEITPAALHDFKRKLEEDKLRERKITSQKTEFFKTWVYPILAPILVAVFIFLLMNHWINPPKIVDTSIVDYPYSLPASTDVSFKYWISNPNNNKLIVSSIGYRFDWEEHNPEGLKFTPLESPQISPLNDAEQGNKEIILNAAGQDEDSRLIEVNFKSPPVGKLYLLTVVIETNKGEAIQNIKLNPISNEE